MREFHGIPASWGVAIGNVVLLSGITNNDIPRYKIIPEEVGAQWKAFERALENAKEDVRSLMANSDFEQRAIFETHFLMLTDPDFLSLLKKRLETDLFNIESVLSEVSEEFVRKLAQSDNPYLRERATDIQDAYSRVLDYLQKKTKLVYSSLKQGSIVVAKQIRPSDVAVLHSAGVAALILEDGGATSHVAILARGYRLPAVMGVSCITDFAVEGTLCCIDGQNGVLLLEPDESSIESFRQKILYETDRLNRHVQQRSRPARTADGCDILLTANIGFPEEVASCLEESAKGIGLFRSEFLFLNNDESSNDISEDAQFEVYRYILSAMKSYPVVIRTMDVGGDKMLSAQEAMAEKNPLMGLRGIRYCLKYRDFFKKQLRALYRASSYGMLKIMFPMITSAEEFIEARNVAFEARNECISAGYAVADNVPIGAMIETPAAALTVDLILKHADFISVGTNDLVQYSSAVDRENQSVAYLYHSFHPSLMRILHTIIKAADEAGKPVSVCGEIAGLPQMVYVLLGFGLRYFSVNLAAVGTVKEFIERISLPDARNVAQCVLSMEKADDIKGYLEQKVRESSIY